MGLVTLLQNTDEIVNVAVDTVQNAAFAYITIQDQGNVYYLLRWNKNWRMYNLIGGKLENRKGDNGDLSRTLRRELFEEIGLNGSCDYDVRELIQVNIRQFSQREKRNKNYHFIVYEVEIYSPELRTRIIKDSQNILVNATEITALETITGKPISQTARHILEEIEGTVFEF